MKNLTNETNDEISALLNKAYSMKDSQMAQSIELTKDALQLSQNADLQMLILKCLSQLSLLHMLQGDQEQSIQFAERVISCSDNTNEVLETAIIRNQELDSFFHRVTHDLKGPITTLISLDALFKDEIKDVNILKYMEMSLTQVHRMNNILDELIKLLKVENDDDDEVILNIDFGKTIDGCLSSCKTLTNFDKVKIEINVQKDLKFRAPWALINTIIQNLIENGVNYARIDQPNPYVRMAISEKNGGVEIVVVDNGIGMKKNVGKNVFEKFYRANKQVPGTGLGLYILKTAVEKLNGEVDLESDVDNGSTFTITLPKYL